MWELFKIKHKEEEKRKKLKQSAWYYIKCHDA